MTQLFSRENIYKVAEGGFLACLGLYLLFLVRGTNTFYMDLPDNSEDVLYNALLILCVLKCILLLWKEREQRKTDIILMISALFVFGLYYLSFRSTEYAFLKFIGIITLGLIGTDYDKAFKVYTVVIFLMISAVIIASLSGMIINFVYYKDGHIRSSGGFGYPTDFAASFFYLIVISWVGFKKCPEWVYILLGCTVLGLSYFICYSVTGIVCSALFIIVVIVHWGIGKYIEKNILSWLVSFAFPLFALASIGSVYLYSKGVPLAYKLDRLLSSRVKGAYGGVKSYGLTLFGTPFNQIGAGGSTFASNQTYNFIDNSYILIMLRYGIVLLVIMAIFWFFATRKATKLGDWRLAYALTLVAFHSLSEHHFTELNYNLLLAAPFSILGFGYAAKNDTPNETVETSDIIKDQRIDGKAKVDMYDIISSLVVAILLILGILVVGPRAFAWVKTIWILVVPYTVKVATIRIAIVIMLIVAMAILALYALERVINSLLRKKRPQIIYMCIMFVAIIISICSYVAGLRLLEKVDSGYTDYVASESGIINIIKEANDKSGGRIYTSEWPVLYYREYGGFTRSFYQGDELARYENTTVILDGNNDSKCFFGQGFLYMDISGLHSIYTNNKAVINALQEAGYHCYGYYSRKRYVSNVSAATINELDVAEDGSVQLDGSEKSLINGPSMNLRNGKYTISYNMYIPETPKIEDLNDSTLICKLRTSNDHGNNIVSETPVYYNQFDENGDCIININDNIPELRGVDFSVIAVDGVKLNVREITYQKTPDRDIHVEYDKKGRKIREEYYNTDGTPYEMPEGYYAVEYEYDQEDRIVLYKYFGTDGNPIETKNGYYQLGKDYNYKNQVIRGSYLDKDGNAIVLKSGESYVEYDYDDDGNQIVQRFFDKDGSLVMIDKGYAELHRKYDDDKKITREEYYNTSGKPVLLAGGYAALEYGYDTSGNRTQIKYFGTDGKPILLRDNYAEIRKSYDGANRVIREAYYNTEGKPIIRTGGYSVKEYKYNNDGYIGIEKLYGIDGRPIVGTSHYAEIHKNYDESGNVIKEAYYGTDSNPITLISGESIREYSYDDNGNRIKIEYLDMDGNPAKFWSDYSIVYSEYNDNAKIIRDTYYDVDNHLMNRKQGYNYAKNEYNNNGELISQKYYNTLGHPVMRIEGFGEVRYEYNEDGLKIREAFFDTFGNKVNRIEGFSEIKYMYDEKGNVSCQLYYDTDGNPVKYNESYYGIKKEYNEYSQVIKEVYLDKDGNSEIVNSDGYSAVEYELDTAGDILVQRYLDENGSLVLLDDEYSEVRRKYDEGGHCIETSYYDNSGNLVNHQGFHAIIEHIYDNYGHKVSEKFYNSKKELVHEIKYASDGSVIN